MHLLAPALLGIYMVGAAEAAADGKLELPLLNIMVGAVEAAGRIVNILLLRFRVQHSLQEPPLILMLGPAAP
jgi:hypothetical protein